MSFRDIKLLVQQYTGLDPSDAGDLPIIKQLVNNAALEVYNTGDLAGTLSEAVFTLDPSYQIAIPSFASNIRGIRDYQSTLKRSLVGMGDRYGNNPWQRDWERYRVKANSPILNDISNASVLTITTAVVDSGIIVITGSTISSQRVSETVTMDATPKTTTNQFVTIHSITSPRARTYDYTVLDLAGVTLAVLYNTEMSTSYQVLLLSSYPWAVVMTPQTVEILYKKALTTFVNDGDEFPAPGYDAAIYYKFQSNWDSLRDGKGEAAILAQQKSDMILNAADQTKFQMQPDSRIVFTPQAAQRIQNRLRMYGRPYYRPRL